MRGAAGGRRRAVGAVAAWVRRQPPKAKAFLGVVAGMAALALIRALVHDHDNLFVAAEAAHAIGISVLIYKLIKERTCAGLSLKSQYLTALFLAVRLYCSLVMEYDIHTLLDTATLATTLWVIYMILFKLKASYMEDKDNFAIHYVVLPCALLALLIHPSTSHNIINRIFWAFCVYLEAASVLPQLRLMQNTKIVEPFTAHYVFALGVARFLSCAHWVLQVLLHDDVAADSTPTSSDTKFDVGRNIGSYVLEGSKIYFIILKAFRNYGRDGVAADSTPTSSLEDDMASDSYIIFWSRHLIARLEHNRKRGSPHQLQGIEVLDTRGRLLTALGYGLWPPMVLLSEIVQTFILADFCYYYVKSLVGGQLVLRLPSGVV